MFEQEILNIYATRIWAVKNEQVETNKVAIDQTHLNIKQHHSLQQVLDKHGKLFEGFLGVYPHQTVHIDLFPDSEPVHHCA